MSTEDLQRILNELLIKSNADKEHIEQDLSHLAMKPSKEDIDQFSYKSGRLVELRKTVETLQGLMKVARVLR